MRRLTIDITGTIPAVEETKAFLADAASDKRLKAVDRLLASNAYADHWTNYWDDVLMGRDKRNQSVDRGAFRAWLRARFAKNERWDKFVFDLATAQGVNSLGGEKRAQMQMPVPGGKSEELEGSGVNGAVNFTLRFSDAPADLPSTLSRVFLGVQIQCAQCHDHKTEKWKQTDFRGFAAAALHIKPEPVDKGPVMGVRRVDLVDNPRVFQRGKDAETQLIAKAKPIALDGADLTQGPNGQGTRKTFGTWLVSEKNPWFARAFVNRMWGHFMGRGFVDPVDDLRPSATADAPALWEALTNEFVASGFDVRALMKLIASMDVYQVGTAKGTKPELWSRYRLVPLGPEELLSALFRATNLDEAAEKEGRLNLPAIRAQLSKNFGFLFDVDEEFDSGDYEGSISQALMLLNGNVTNVGSRAVSGTALDSILASNRATKDAVTAMYLRALSRMPNAEEIASASDYVDGATAEPPATTGAGAERKKRGKGKADPLTQLARKNPVTLDPKRAAYEDLYWALLNSSEFVFNH